MKILKNLLTLFAFVLAFSTGAFGQISANDNINATANVVSAITAGNTGNLNFGTILSNASPSIAADSSAAGYVQFTGATDGATIDIDVVYPAQLTGGGGAFNFTASNLGISETDAGAPSGTAVQSVTTGYSHTVSDNGTDTNFFVTVGGSLSPDGTPGDGSYTGTITITASYQ